MDQLKLTEELITIIALDSFRHDLHEMLTESEVKVKNQEFIEACYTMAELTLEKKLKNFPEYERLLNEFHDSHTERYRKTEGDNPSIHGPEA